MMNRRLGYEQFKNLQSSMKRSESPQRNRQPLLIEPAGHYLEKRLASLHDLPVEVRKPQPKDREYVSEQCFFQLLYEMLLVSLNPSFTVLSRHIRSVFKSTSLQFRANYVIVATESHNLPEQRFDVLWWGQRLRAWLCYGVCDREVLQLLISQTQPPETVHRVVPCEGNNKFQLPARIFRSLASAGLENRDAYLAREASAMDFLRYLLGPAELPAPALVQDSQPNNQAPLTMFGDANSHGGYFLAEAVRLGSEPFVDLLLAHGADPLRQAGTAISLAISG